MRALIQRVSQAKVTVDSVVSGQIDTGILVLLGVSKTDTAADAEFVAAKILNLRIFTDDEGKMNRSVLETGGELCWSFLNSLSMAIAAKDAAPVSTKPLLLNKPAPSTNISLPSPAVSNLPVETGVFQADMEVSLTNDGPVTLLVESR